MATFCNQSSNLSALSSALTSYSQVLDVSENAMASLTREEHQENAAEFLKIQQRRVEAIDDSFRKATGHILPSSQDVKTVTELAEVCRLVQEATRQKMGLLRTRLDLMGITASWHDSVTSPKVVFDNGSTDIQWSIGAPLDCVIEGDVETEGATTPSSLLYTSPFPSTTKQPRRASLTPPTPTMNKFAFSSSTASIIECMNRLTPSSSTKRPTNLGHVGADPRSTPSPLNQSGHRLNLVGFHDDDDMISLNTSAETNLNHPTGSTIFKSPIQKMKAERLQFLQRMESMLERVEEELNYESRPSDEMTRASGAVKTHSVKSRPSDENSLLSEKSGVTEASRTMERPSNNKFLEELEDVEHEDQSSSGTDNDEDSTNVIATLVAEKPEPLRANIQRPVPVFSHRPTHITVDNGAPSPAHTNLTMDGTMMNDTMISGSVMMHDGGDENLSVMTPVLDRYRLDPDDNSIGVKVVPNPRGKHHHNIPPTPREEPGRTTTSEFYEDSDGFLSPRGLPASISARTTKQYRKTPYPKKQQERSSDDENHPNTPMAPFSPASSTTSFDASNPESSFSVPPLRPRSFGPSQTTAGARSSTASRTQSLPIISARLPRTPEPKPFGQQHIDLIEQITITEYNSAPRVVHMHVSLDEANQTIAVLDSYLSSKKQHGFTEQEASGALSTLFESEQKCRSVLLSLCHWKRLTVNRQEDGKTRYAVNWLEQ